MIHFNMRYYELWIKNFRHDSAKYGSTCSPKSFFEYPIEKDFVCQTVPEKERFWIMLVKLRMGYLKEAIFNQRYALQI